MICDNCGSFNAHLAFVDQELQIDQQDHWETNVEVVFCPDCERMAFLEEDYLEGILESLGYNPEFSYKLRSFYHFSDGMILDQKSVYIESLGWDEDLD